MIQVKIRAVNLNIALGSLEENISLVSISPGEIHGALSPAEQRRIHVQQAQERDRPTNEALGKGAVPQYLRFDSGNVQIGFET